ncbi:MULTISPECIES: Cu(I)-responsive transcriptional regulator [unclassified Bradyrhizobium]|jgi:MerR family transcriptional regulator, copper efflux regulator|uniref:Cu(I)-responsive transcriptional regulator n=1 Tax=unclassified Bradyrhizobium TaxID=2631580 RepID=UPI0007C866A6
MEPMTIGQAAQRSGVPPKTIRYYESVGLVGPAARGENKYRAYSDKEVEVLRFINRARGLGFSLSEIEQLLALYRDRNRPSREVKRLALLHIDDLDRKIVELETIKQALQHLAEKCRGDDRPDCPILDDLGSGTSAPVTASARDRLLSSHSATIRRPGKRP